LFHGDGNIPFGPFSIASDPRDWLLGVVGYFATVLGALVDGPGRRLFGDLAPTIGVGFVATVGVVVGAILGYLGVQFLVTCVRFAHNFVYYAYYRHQLTSRLVTLGWSDFFGSTGVFRGLVRALRRVEDVPPAVRELPVEAHELKFDARGPYFAVTIGGEKLIVRVSHGSASAAFGLSQFSLPPKDLGGKEAVLLGSRTPVTAEMPAYQVTVQVGDVAHGQAVRVSEGKLLLTRHQFDVMKEQPNGDVSLSNGKVRLPLSALRVADSLCDSADLVALKIDPGVFSALGVKVAKLGFATPGPCLIYSRNELGQSIVSIGRVGKSVTKKTGILAHNCHTQPGSSGAAVVQDGHVVAIHTGANPEKTENQATSLRYFKTVLVGKNPESYFEDSKFDLDAENERLLEKLQSYQVANSADRDKFTAADDLWDEIERLRYGGGVYDSTEIEERLARINLGEATEKDVKEYLHKQSGIAFASKKNVAKGRESSDIKEGGSLTSGTTPSKTTAKSTPRVSDSSTLDEPVPSARPERKRKAPSSSEQGESVALLKEMRTLLDEQSTKLSDSVTRIAELEQSLKVSSSKPPPTSQPKNVSSTPKPSKGLSAKPSKAT
jgi:hypothetical protein